jgi:transposase
LETDQAERLAAASPIVAVAIEEAVEKQKPARRPLPEHLPREEVHHPAACACPHCGGALRRISEEVTETLDYVPGRFKSLPSRKRGSFGMCAKSCPAGPATR